MKTHLELLAVALREDPSSNSATLNLLMFCNIPLVFLSFSKRRNLVAKPQL